VAGARAAIDRVAGGGGEIARFGDLSERVLEAIRTRAQPDGRVRGARTGLGALDEATGGLQPGWLVIVAAETGGGKTALAMQTAINVVLDGGTALACNLEMTREELAERAIVHFGEINSQLVRLGRVDEVDVWPRAVRAADRLAQTHFYLDDSATTMPAIAARARRWRARHREIDGILVVDFVQLIRSSFVKGQTRAQEVGLIAQDLKALAKELRVPIMLVSQLNRAGLKAGRPSKSDLKESGDLENAADLILLPYHHGDADGEVQIIVDKFRHGQCFVVDARWIGRHFAFTNMDDERR
jgi:replicative DNA helicase